MLFIEATQHDGRAIHINARYVVSVERYTDDYTDIELLNGKTLRLKEKIADLLKALQGALKLDPGLQGLQAFA